MNRQEAIEFLMDHYENPRNYGPLDHADVSLNGGNPGCADIISMHARFDKDGKLEAVNWEGEGCTGSVYIGGVRPSLPMLMLAAVTVPSAERWPLMITLAPGFRAERSVGS